MPSLGIPLRRTAAIAAVVLCPGAAMAEGMPQLDFANPLTTSQVVWGVVIFVLLYLLLSRWTLPRVGQVLDQRAARIEADLETARAAKSTADAAVAEMTDATGRARAEAQAEISAAVGQAKQAASAQAADLDARLEAQLKEAEERIAVARGAAMGALRQVATDTATTIIGRLTGRAPDARAVEGAVGTALAARGQG
jgi:F-type H+-transporting ATPase subunit b